MHLILKFILQTLFYEQQYFSLLEYTILHPQVLMLLSSVDVCEEQAVNSKQKKKQWHNLDIEIFVARLSLRKTLPKKYCHHQIYPKL